MELHEATYIICMLIVHVVRNAGKITFEDKIKVLQLCFSLLRSVEDTLYLSLIHISEPTRPY